MPVPVAAGHPQYSGNFIPEIWSGKLLVKFYSACVAASITNTDYEGEIKDVGDTVNIRTLADIVIRDYSKGGTLLIQRPDSPMVQFTINKAKYFNFICDDIDRHQADIPLMDKWSTDAGRQMGITIDRGFLADAYVDAHADNKGATAGAISNDIDMGSAGAPVAITKVNITDTIVDAGTVLTEQDVPTAEGLYGVITHWMAGMILKSELKDASLAGDGKSRLLNGRLGIIGGFELYESNLLTSVTDGAWTCWHLMFGHKMAVTFAAQMNKMETLKAESTFGNLVRGLNVYDYKVLKSEALVDLYVRKG
jgi:hypothetical protein